jgi:ribosomal protein S18 acetylase RimI-like enzyme
MMTDEIRRATANDYPAYAVLLRELGVDDPTPSAERFAADLAPRILMYERDGAPIGYVSYDKLAANGYIRNLAVAPTARGAGVGAALMMAAAARLRAHGVTEAWHLNVKADNAVAIRLYERFGMAVEHRSVALRFAWAHLDRLPADDGHVTMLPVPAEDDDDIERALGILGGRLHVSRSRGSNILVQLRDEQLAPVGVACFDPAFPGAFPFCATRPALAAPLLRALAPHVRPGDLDLQVVIEDDDDLAGALIAAGAVVRMRLLHYAGPLPAPAPA